MQRLALASSVEAVAARRGYTLVPTSRHGFQLSRKGHVLLANALLSEVAEWLWLRQPDDKLPPQVRNCARPPRERTALPSTNLHILDVD